MTQTALPSKMLPLSPADLETVLSAWRETTLRLEQTHKALREEVKRLTDELEIKNRELARKNRLADLGQMASHVAHEVRNNLVPVTLYLSLLRRRILDDPGNLDMLDKITAGFTALDATVNDLLHFTAEREPQLKTLKLKKLIEDVCSSLSPQFEAQGIETILDISPAQTIAADRDMLRRAVLNLCLNAVDAMPDGGTINVNAVDQADCVVLKIADSGPGLSDDVRHRVFEPFFTTKPGGTGLGLAIVYRIAEVHQGNVTAANNPQGGAVFSLRIPRDKLLEAAA
jgi:signal transduction histidine kinase